MSIDPDMFWKLGKFIPRDSSLVSSPRCLSLFPAGLTVIVEATEKMGGIDGFGDRNADVQ